MNDRLRQRLQEHLAPGHECTPYVGGCHMPHYWYNHSAPRYLVAWPEPSAARARADEVREERDWGGDEPTP
ncbi:MAG: hypothetical protein WC273_04690 [Dehalococcoidia bacterium]